jgi:dTDP-glucose 4,6-dehydratase
MRHYCIAGGAGFLGSHLTESLLTDGHRVTVLDNYSTGRRENILETDIVEERFTIHEHDVTKPLPDIGAVDVVYHLASIASPPAYKQQPVKTLRAGADATRHLLDLANDHDATFVLASTSEIYGDPEQHPQSESYRGNVNPFGPRSCYDESKRYAESLTYSYREQYNTDVRIARIFNTYGPRMRDGRAIPTFIRQALDGGPITVHGDGQQTRSFCYVDDLITALRHLPTADISKPVNLGNPDERTILSVAELIRNLTHSDAAIYHTERPPEDPTRRRPDITRAKESLDWIPTTALEDGLQKTIEEW